MTDRQTDGWVTGSDPYVAILFNGTTNIDEGSILFKRLMSAGFDVVSQYHGHRLSM